MADYNLGTARGTIEIDYKGGGPQKAKADLEQVSKTGMSTDEALNKTARGAGIAGTAIAAGLAVAANSAASFEQRLSAVEAVSGATASEMDQISAKALQLGKDTAFSATESATAMEELVKAGLSVEDVLNGAADATVALAAAGEVDMPEAATIASNAMNQFGLAAKDMPAVADAIAGAANASAIDVSEFGYSLQQAGAVANLAGLDFEDTAIAIAQMGNAGIRGSDAGTSLKSMLQRLQPTTAKQAALMEQLGLVTADGSNAFYDQEGRLKGLADIQETLKGSLEGMTAQQKQAALQTLFGADAIRAAAVLADEGAAGYNKMAESMGKVTAADVAATKMDNLKGSIEEMTGSLETAGIQLGTILLPTIRSLVDSITGAINAFLNLSDGQQKAVVAALVLSSGLLLGVAALIKIAQFARAARAAFVTLRIAMLATSAASGVTAGIAALMAGLTGAATGATLLTKALNLLGRGIRIVAVGFRILAVAMIANPIGIIVTAIIALVALLVVLYKRNETVRNVINGVWNSIRSAVGAVVNWFVSTVVPMLQSVWNGVVAGAMFLWNMIRTIFTQILAFWQGVWGMFGPVVIAVWNLIKAIIQLGLALILFVIGAHLKLILAVFRAAWTAIRAVTSAVWNAIKAVVSSVARALVGVVGPPVRAVLGIMKSVWNGVKSATSSVWNALKGIVSRAVDGFMVVVRGIKNKVLSPFRSAGTWLLNAGKAIIQGLLDGIESLINKVTDKLDWLTDKIPDWKGPERTDKKLLYQPGRWIMEGLDEGISDGSMRVLSNLSRMNVAIPATVDPALAAAVDSAISVSPADLARFSALDAHDQDAVRRFYLESGQVDLTSRSTAMIRGVVVETDEENDNFENLINAGKRL